MRSHLFLMLFSVVWIEIRCFSPRTFQILVEDVLERTNTRCLLAGKVHGLENSMVASRLSVRRVWCLSVCKHFHWRSYVGRDVEDLRELFSVERVSLCQFCRHNYSEKNVKRIGYGTKTLQKSNYFYNEYQSFT